MTDGSAAIIESGGKILLQKRDLIGIVYPGHWSLFGGKANENESPIETLLRELEEELSRNFKVTDFTYVGRFRRVEQPTGTIHIFHNKGIYSVKDFNLKEGKSMAFVNPQYLSKLNLCPDMENILRYLYRY